MSKKVKKFNFSNMVDDIEVPSKVAVASVVQDDISNVTSNNVVITNSNTIVQYASPNKFFPYIDTELRLDLYTGEERERLKESIIANGIMIPIICDETMMIIAGHNRVDIAKELGIEVPYIIQSGLSNEEKDLICIDTNLLNRQLIDYKPSQLAKVLKVKYDAEKHQGQRTDLTLSPEVTKLTGVKIGQEYSLSRMQISRYIRLNNLINEALDLIDNKELSIKCGYELSFFEHNYQNIILKHRLGNNINEKIVKLLKAELSNLENIETIEEKEKYFENKVKELLETPKNAIQKLNYKNIKKYIPDNITPYQIEEYIIKALQFYSENNI